MLEFVYCGKENISRIFDVFEPFITLRNKLGRLWNFLWTIKRHEELNVLLPFSLDVKVQQDQQEKMAVMGFLAALPSKYDFVKT